MHLNHQIVRHNSALYKQMVDLRYEVLRRPLGMVYAAEQLAAEFDQIHIACLKDGELIACLSLVEEDGGAVKMRQVAVAPALQGQGIGTQLCLYAERIAHKHVATHLYCHARKTAVSFYKKLGYQQIGDEFEEVGIPHFYMQKLLIH